MDFSKFNKAVAKQLDKLTKGELFVVSADKDELYNLYLASYPEGTNPIYKERTEHDCTCCKQFIRQLGLVVGFVDGRIQSIWDISVDEPAYQAVADSLAAWIKSKAVVDVFRSDVAKIGNEKSHQQLEDGSVKAWDHFSYNLPTKFVMKKDNIPTFLGTKRTNKELLERAVKEMKLDACKQVKELIDQNSIYRGSEHLHAVNLAIKVLSGFSAASGEAQEQAWLWNKSLELGESSRFKNSVIGTLLMDVSEGVDLDKAVASFETKTAPANYKRPTALITPAMIKTAEKKVTELGLQGALHRRFAVTEDLTVNNVLFADRSAKKVMGVFDQLQTKVSSKPAAFDKVQEIGIQEFIEKVLPTATGLELMLENKHTSNLMSIVAPEDKEAGNILKWNNNFSWTYNGEVADSMKERVKAAGGNVTGDLCCRLAWEYTDDLDFYMTEPSFQGNRSVIYFGTRNRASINGGKLDVDANGGSGMMAHPVENIFYQDKRTMRDGVYKLSVNNYNRRSSGVGFDVEVEFGGNVYNFSYDKALRDGATVDVAEFIVHKNEITIKEILKGSTTAKEVWGINTNKWTKVDLVLNSPNHWDGEETGNKHWFFILEGCKNPDDARGFYNEFLNDSFTEHRKVFEVLGAQLKAKHSDNQLSGVGFSSTVKNSVLCKVSGNVNRVLKINF